MLKVNPASGVDINAFFNRTFYGSYNPLFVFVSYLLQTGFKACTVLLVHRTFFQLVGVTFDFEVIIGIAIRIYLAQFRYLQDTNH